MQYNYKVVYTKSKSASAEMEVQDYLCPSSELTEFILDAILTNLKSRYGKDVVVVNVYKTTPVVSYMHVLTFRIYDIILSIEEESESPELSYSEYLGCVDTLLKAVKTNTDKLIIDEITRGNLKRATRADVRLTEHAMFPNDVAE